MSEAAHRGFPDAGAGQRLVTTLRLAWDDLLHEWLLTACLVAAIAAVMAPIMLLTALKFGFINNLREKLIQDPSFRLVQPAQAVYREPSFFDDLRGDKRVAFVQPTVTLSARPSRLMSDKAPKGVSVSMRPTSEGDPLILEHGGRVPVPAVASGQPDQVALTAEAATKLQLAVGDFAKLRITRTVKKRREKVFLDLEVVSILQPAADGSASVYLPETVIRQIENYKSGIRVPEREGWDAVSQPPRQVFEEIILATPFELSDIEINDLIVDSGVTSAERMADPDERIVSAVGLQPDEATYVRLGVKNKLVDGRSVRALATAMPDREVRVLGAVGNLKLKIGGRELPARAMTQQVLRERYAAAGAGNWPRWGDKQTFFRSRNILLPGTMRSQGVTAGSVVSAGLVSAPDHATRDLQVDLVVSGYIDEDFAVVPMALAGMLATAREAPLVYDNQSHQLYRSSIGFYGYRLYGKTIDDIPGLVDTLRKRGIEVRAKADIIDQLQRLDSSLTAMILIVALVALVGGATVVVASFYAAVERKRHELALFRLIGFPRSSMFQFPLIQSVIVGLAGFIAGTVLFYVFAGIINAYFADNLRQGEQVCRLPVSYVAAFGAVCLAVALASSLLSAFRATKIDPAEGMRVE